MQGVISKLISIVTPLTLMALMGVLMVVNGIAHMKQENNVLNFFFGIPLALGAFGVHMLIRHLTHHKTAYVWAIEFILVGLFWYAFMYVW
ncbi:hypothetical protein [Larkinella rosea]|uniref:Uncharacterized protein n=1 Tax=Larkinella rosea TaxID=2025312 RepID=A0A3P1BCS6_9BACT|nr:hypothetical protein [Larkinella rosea]RRA98859.1 hypothetical protein EHT25_28120 [Larkinella rosea]